MRSTSGLAKGWLENPEISKNGQPGSFACLARQKYFSAK
jgi:hypothetical protein